MKRAGLLIALLFWGTTAWSMPIISVITGADMAGMKVTAFFADNTSETATWVTTDTDASVPYGEGFAGEAAGTGWVLSQRGYTEGNFDGTNPLGVWTLTYAGSATGGTSDDSTNTEGTTAPTGGSGSEASAPAITSLKIDAFVAGIMFDKFLDVEYTPGSNIGRTFRADRTTSVPNSAQYSGLISDPDLWAVLTLSWDNGFAPGSTLRFMADTDKIPEPPVYALMLIGLLGLGLRAAKARA